MTLNEITTRLSTPNLPPGELSELRLWLGGQYSFYGALMEEIELKKASEWLKIRSREGIKSDTQADREWELTDTGQAEIKLKWTLKRIEKLLSSINTRLRVMENESRNQY